MNENNQNVNLHQLYRGDSRNLKFIKNESIHLILTSPPYWNIKKYNAVEGQLGHIDSYEQFHKELTKIWKECYRLLVPGGRLVIVIGDACKSRREFGRHVIFPNHADIVVNCRKIGFDNLNPIIWHKIANANFEVENGTKFLGKPYQPNAIIKNDIEFILMQRKPGGYRKPSEEQKKKSKITKEEFNAWFQQFWNMTGASTKKHPAPFPEELANRLIRMFSFWGDTILDPFVGSGTTMIAAMKAERNSIGLEIDKEYCDMTINKFSKYNSSLFINRKLEFIDLLAKQDKNPKKF